MGDVGALRHQGVRGDAQALHQRREHPEAADPPGGQHDEAGQDRAGAAPEDVDERGEPAEHREGGQPPERRQRRVHVRVGRAEDGPALRVQEVVAVEPEIGRLGEEEEREQPQEVRARPGGDHRASRRQDEDPTQEVDERRQGQSEQEHSEDPGERSLPQRELEHVEGDVLLEQRVQHAERLGVPVEQDRLPFGAGGQPHQDGQDGGHRLDQPLEERLQHHPAGQPEGLLELPEHVRRSRADGGAQVHDEEQEGQEPDADQDAAACRGDPQEDGQVADLLEPEPVRVEGHGLEGQDRCHADQDQERGPPGQRRSSSIS